MQMPVMDGIEAIRAKAIEAERGDNSHLYILGISADSDSMTVTGANHFKKNYAV